MLIHFVVTPRSDSFPSTLETPQLALPNFAFRRLTASKAKTILHACAFELFVFV